eukprot:Lithocolla_globosa_v1_NODE_9815_length_665_cov_8.501639.p2 type:complete len:100 gc:universal NODE_9815_length_665_cov_8.501639:168-467(+)
MFFCPFLCCFFKLLLVCSVDLGHLRCQWVLQVWALQKRQDALEHLDDLRGRLPIGGDKQLYTDISIRINVRVVDLSDKFDLWGLEGVLGGEHHVHLEGT